MYHNSVTNLIHFHFHKHFIVSQSSTCSGIKHPSSGGITLTVFGVSCMHLLQVWVNWLQPANSYKCTQLTPKTTSVVPPGDGHLMPETCRGLQHNKVFVKVKVY
jgi:hypothetical protein